MGEKLEKIWKDCMRSHLPELLTDIDTANGLEGAMRSESVLIPMIIKRIWVSCLSIIY
jgi:hypothetical protein